MNIIEAFNESLKNFNGKTMTCVGTIITENDKYFVAIKNNGEIFFKYECENHEDAKKQLYMILEDAGNDW
jgi:hypothetical protein